MTRKSKNIAQWLGVVILMACLVLVAAALQETAREEPETEKFKLEEVSTNPKRLKDYDLPGLETKVNLKSLDPWDVVQLIEFLAYKGGLNNIVIGKGVSGLTTKLKFDDVAIGDALEVVLSVNSLAYQVKGGIITVMMDEEYRALYGTSFYDHKQVRIVELKYANPGHVAALLAPVKSSIGTVVSDPITGTLILVDTPEKIREMRTIIDKTDISTVSRVLPTETKAFQLQYASVEDMQREVSALLTAEIGSVRADRRTRTLLVTDLPHSIKKIAELIRIFDKRPKQVFIESKIVQVTLSDEYSLGINWEHLFQGLEPRFSLASKVQPAALKRHVGQLDYATIVGGGDLSVVLNAIRSIGETKTLSNPHIAVLDGEEATIKVVSEEPYVETKFESGSTNVSAETYQFIEVGTLLSVTPRVNEDGFISMVIKPEVSSFERSDLGQLGRYTIPIVTKSYAETTVMVKDGETIIIAGMIQDSKATVHSSVPVLGRLPLFGVLFRSESDVVTRAERVVFLTPRIITGEERFLRTRDTRKEPKPLRAVERREERISGR